MRILLVVGITQVAVEMQRCSVISMFYVKYCPNADRPHNDEDYMCEEEGSEARMITTKHMFLSLELEMGWHGFTCTVLSKC